MRAGPPDITSLRPITSTVPQNPHNSTPFSVSDMHPPIRPLGPPNAQPQFSGSTGPPSSQIQNTQGARPHGSPLANLGPPNNTSMNSPVVNGQGIRPPMHMADLGNLIRKRIKYSVCHTMSFFYSFIRSRHNAIHLMF